MQEFDVAHNHVIVMKDPENSRTIVIVKDKFNGLVYFGYNNDTESYYDYVYSLGYDYIIIVARDDKLCMYTADGDLEVILEEVSDEIIYGLIKNAREEIDRNKKFISAISNLY